MPFIVKRDQNAAGGTIFFFANRNFLKVYRNFIDAAVTKHKAAMNQSTQHHCTAPLKVLLTRERSLDRCFDCVYAHNLRELVHAIASVRNQRK